MSNTRIIWREIDHVLAAAWAASSKMNGSGGIKCGSTFSGFSPVWYSSGYPDLVSFKKMIPLLRFLMIGWYLLSSINVT